jgi:hypothetical protein
MPFKYLKFFDLLCLLPTADREGRKTDFWKAHGKSEAKIIAGNSQQKKRRNYMKLQYDPQRMGK